MIAAQNPHIETNRPSVRFVIAVVLGLMLLGAACSSSSDDAATDDTTAGDPASSDTTEATDDEPDESASEPDSSETTTAMEEETDAMGEDSSEQSEATTPSTLADNGATPGTTLPALGSGDLAAALEASTGNAFSLPFMYLSVEQDCEGCADSMSLYYVPSEAKPSILTLAGAFIDGVEQADFSQVAPSLQAGDPRWIAEQLDGTDATFGIDARSGAITSWTLDGAAVTIRCLQVDTRPIDMRSELCENSVIG